LLCLLSHFHVKKKIFYTVYYQIHQFSSLFFILIKENSRENPIMIMIMIIITIIIIVIFFSLRQKNLKLKILFNHVILNYKVKF
jgi:hypothetical protein